MASTSILSSAVNKVGRLALMTGAAALALAGAAVAQAPAQAPVSTSAQAPAHTAAAPAGVKPAVAANLAKPLWVSLSPAQKLALEPLAGEWDRMEAPRKQKWLDIANRFASMKPDEQARVHEKMREWVKMTPDERRLVRENYTRAKKLDVAQKSEQWEKYQQLPEEQKQKLAAEAATAKKQLTNLPTPAQANLKTATPIKKTVQAPCPVGSVRNPALANAANAGSPAVAACIAVAPVAAPANAGVANAPASSTLPPAATSAIPATAPVNAK